jgi:hypothetical protein
MTRNVAAPTFYAPHRRPVDRLLLWFALTAQSTSGTSAFGRGSSPAKKGVTR